MHAITCMLSKRGSQDISSAMLCFVISIILAFSAQLLLSPAVLLDTTVNVMVLSCTPVVRLFPLTGLHKSIDVEKCDHLSAVPLRKVGSRGVASRNMVVFTATRMSSVAGDNVQNSPKDFGATLLFV